MKLKLIALAILFMILLSNTVECAQKVKKEKKQKKNKQVESNTKQQEEVKETEVQQEKEKSQQEQKQQDVQDQKQKNSDEKLKRKQEKEELKKKKQEEKVRLAEEKKQQAEQQAQEKQQKDEQKAQETEQKLQQDQAKNDEKQKLQEQKEEQKKLKQQEKLKKQELKQQKQQEKLKLQQEKEALKQQEKELKEQQKLEAQKLKIQQDLERAQAELAAQKQCELGHYKNTANQTECIPCAQNCESCRNEQVCNYCQPGFFRVVENKKNNTYCASEVPKGYVYQLSKFQKLNPEIQKTQEDIPIAVAYHGKKAVTNQPEQLPFTLENGAPTYKGQKVRVDVVPCKTQCAVCAEGYLLDIKEKTCYSASQCVWPRVQEGEQCIGDDDSVLKAKIQVKEKAQKLNSTVPPSKRIDLSVLLNKLPTINTSYEWNVYNATSNELLNDRVFTKGNLGKKIRADLNAFAQGAGELVFKALVKDSSVENDQGHEVEYKHSL